MVMKTANKASISITIVKSMKIGLKGTKSNKACTRAIYEKSYELVWFLQSYKVLQRRIFIRSEIGAIRRWIINRSIHSEPIYRYSRLSYHHMR